MLLVSDFEGGVPPVCTGIFVFPLVSVGFDFSPVNGVFGVVTVMVFDKGVGRVLSRMGCLFEREGFAHFPVKFVKFTELYLGITCPLLCCDMTNYSNKKKGTTSVAP